MIISAGITFDGVIDGQNGTNGDTTLQAYKWNQSATTGPEKPSRGQYDKGWTATAPDRPVTTGDHFLWMTQTVRHTAEDGTVTYDEWSTPVRISGDTGKQGDDGYGLTLTPSSLIFEEKVRTVDGSEETYVDYANNIVSAVVYKGEEPQRTTVSVITTGQTSEGCDLSKITVSGGTVTMGSGSISDDVSSGHFTIRVTADGGAFDRLVRINFYVNRLGSWRMSVKQDAITEAGRQITTGLGPDGAITKAYEGAIDRRAAGLRSEFSERISRAGADGRNLFGFSKGIVFGTFLPFVQGYGIVSNVGSAGQAYIHHLGFDGVPGHYVVTFQARMLTQSRKLFFRLWGEGETTAQEETVTTSWRDYELHFSIDSFLNDTSASGQLYINDLHKNDAGVEQSDANWNRIVIRHLKIERGLAATGFCASDEDIAYIGQGQRITSLTLSEGDYPVTFPATVDGRGSVYQVSVSGLSNTYPWSRNGAGQTYWDYISQQGVTTLEAGRCYTLSFWAKASVGGVTITQHLYRSGYDLIDNIGSDLYMSGSYGTVSESMTSDGKTHVQLTTAWKQYFVHFYAKNPIPSVNVIPLRVEKDMNYGSGKSIASCSIYMSDIVLQEGYVMDTATFSSLIEQNARRISLVQQAGTRRAGIDVQEGTVNLFGDRVSFSNADGTIRDKVWIDPNDGTLHAVNGDFSGNGTFRGTVYASDGEFTGKIKATGGFFKGENSNGFSINFNADDRRITIKGPSSVKNVSTLAPATGSVEVEYVSIGQFRQAGGSSEVHGGERQYYIQSDIRLYRPGATNNYNGMMAQLDTYDGLIFKYIHKVTGETNRSCYGPNSMRVFGGIIFIDDIPDYVKDRNSVVVGQVYLDGETLKVRLT